MRSPPLPAHAGWYLGADGTTQHKNKKRGTLLQVCSSGNTTAAEVAADDGPGHNATKALTAAPLVVKSCQTKSSVLRARIHKESHAHPRSKRLSPILRTNNTKKHVTLPSCCKIRHVQKPCIMLLNNVFRGLHAYVHGTNPLVALHGNATLLHQHNTDNALNAHHQSKCVTAKSSTSTITTEASS